MLWSCNQHHSISSPPKFISQKTALSTRGSETPWHQISKLCQFDYGCTRERFEAKIDELESVVKAKGRAEPPLTAAAYLIGVTWGHMSKMWSKTPLEKPRPAASTSWSCHNDPTENRNNRGGLQNPSPLSNFSSGQGLQEGSLLFSLSFTAPSQLLKNIETLLQPLTW